MASPHNSRLTAQAPLRRLRHGICVAKMLDNVGLRYPHRASGAKAPRTLRPLPLLRFAVSATGGAHLCSIQYYLRFWLSICRTSLAVSALRIMRHCLICCSLPFGACWGANVHILPGKTHCLPQALQAICRGRCSSSARIAEWLGTRSMRTMCAPTVGDAPQISATCYNKLCREQS